MEVGPLARVLMLYAKGNAQATELVNMTLHKLDLPVTALYSTLGRTAARTLETKIFADAMQGWYDQLIANIKAGDVKTHNDKLWEPSSWPSVAKGVGYTETITRRSCRVPGMPVRAMRRDRTGLTRPR